VDPIQMDGCQSPGPLSAVCPPHNNCNNNRLQALQTEGRGPAPSPELVSVIDGDASSQQRVPAAGAPGGVWLLLVASYSSF
jgi:hypothetical protein